MREICCKNKLIPALTRPCSRVFFALLLSLFWLGVEAAPIQRAITISTDTTATFSDWTTSDNSTAATVAADWNTATDVTNNSGQFTTDEQYDADGNCTTMVDLDCSTTAAGVGRDLKKFAYTWDTANLYMYVERFASSTSANDWWFYIDANNDGLMSSGETILNVAWSGANGNTTRQLWTYNPSRAAGDPLTCPATGTNSVEDGWCPVADKGDGYDMPGTISSGTTYATLEGGATADSGLDANGNLLEGVAMETFIAWSDLGLTGPGSVGFHISSSNGTNLPTQLDDNMDALGGGSGGIAFSDLAISKTASSATVVGGDQFTYTLTVTNNGDSDATGIEVTDALPAEVTYASDDDTINTTLTGSTLVWNIAALANGDSTSLVITVTSNIVAADTTVSNTATITDQVQADTDTSNNSATYDILSLIPAPDLEITKSHIGNFSEGATGAYTISVSNIGIGNETGTITVTDTLPAGLTYVSGTGTDWSCNAVAQIVTCTNPGPLLSGDSLADIQLLVIADATAIPSVTNSVTVAGDTHENELANNTATDLTTVTAADNQQCYAVDGNNDFLSLVETSNLLDATNNETDIGNTGVTGTGSIAYDCGSGVLYAANGGTLGTLSQAGGSFTALGAAGASSNGSIGGNINFSDIRGLTQDPASGALHASVARVGTDVLIQINKATGAFVPNAFGAGVDYVTIGSIADISDIAAVSGGTLYGIDNGSNNLISIDKTLGTTAVIGALGVTSITGLGTDAVGALWGTTSTGAVTESLYEIDTASGAASNPRVIDGGAGTSFDYAAFDCIANCALKQAELAITKVASNANPLVAASITYTVTVTNNGGDTATTAQVSDVLPAGVTFASSTASQGSYEDATGVWYIGTINSGANASLQISVTVDAGTAGTTITNTASITYATQSDPNTANNTASVNIVPVNSNLSTSSKTGVDVNGGNLEQGDIIRYTISLIETAGAAATNVIVTDDIPANVGNFTIVSLPAVSTDNSTFGGTGANGTGYLNITNIDVAAGATETIIFEVTLLAGTANNTIISNTATITNPSGPGATPAASPLVVTGGSVTKTLYLQNADTLTRIQHGTNTNTTIAKTTSNTWTLNPAIFSDMTLDSSLSLAVPVWITATANDNATATLSTSGGTVIGSSTITLSKNTTQRYTFSINFAADILITSPDAYTLTITNESNSKSISIDTLNAGQYSQIDLNSPDVIKVNSVEFYDDVYPGGNLITSVLPGTTVYVRSEVQDPFGSFDITSASIEILDSLGSVKVVSGTAMTETNDSLAGTKTYEYSYLVPGTGPTGTWTALVTANEGTEGTVLYTATGNLIVRESPSITMLKTVQTISDPVNAGTNPKAIPGAFLNYTILATNSGAGYADTDTTFITDPIPAGTELFVGDLGGAAPGDGPVLFSAGSSGLSYTTATDLSYSTDGGTTWSLVTPLADANGVNASVTNIQINPKGIFAAAGASNTSFSLTFRVRLQ